MVGIVQAHTDEFAGPGDAGTNARGSDFGKARRINGPQAREAFIGERVAGNVGNDAGEIADLAVRIEKGGPFGARRAMTEEFHQARL
jgi:hypothetical protein